MKKSILSLLAFCLICYTSNAQEQKKIEHIIQIGTGCSWCDDDTQRTGMALSVGYGMDISVKEQFSVMPMVEYRVTSESMIRSGWDGICFNEFSFLDFSVSGRYHFISGKTPVVVGIGPYISFVCDRDKYCVDADPKSNLNGKAKLKQLDLGLMPSVSFLITNHLSLGVKMNIGMLDSSEYYPEISDQESRYLKSAEAFARVRF